MPLVGLQEDAEAGRNFAGIRAAKPEAWRATRRVLSCHEGPEASNGRLSGSIELEVEGKLRGKVGDRA
eukprot:430175-Alexandrium_andersonii.AAC.1